MFKRLLIHIKDKLYEPTYRELWEEQNMLIDHQKVEIRRRDKKILRLNIRFERIDLSEQN